MPWSRLATRWQNIQQEAYSDAAVIVVILLIVVVENLYIEILILIAITLIVVVIVNSIDIVIIVIVVYCRVVVPQRLHLQQSCAALGPNSNKAGCLKKAFARLESVPKTLNSKHRYGYIYYTSTIYIHIYKP